MPFDHYRNDHYFDTNDDGGDFQSKNFEDYTYQYVDPEYYINQNKPDEGPEQLPVYYDNQNRFIVEPEPPPEYHTDLNYNPKKQAGNIFQTLRYPEDLQADIKREDNQLDSIEQSYEENGRHKDKRPNFISGWYKLSNLFSLSVRLHSTSLFPSRFLVTIFAFLNFSFKLISFKFN